jgi:hypothetical protein
MTIRQSPFAVAVLSVILTFLGAAEAVTSRTIEAVRAKKVLDSTDLKVIDDFLAQAITEILNTSDFSTVSDARSIILANSASSEPGQVQFAEQFSESAKKHITAALQKAEQITPPARRFKVITNLLMLVDGLADPRLVDIPLKYADNKSPVISYWAVHCLTNHALAEKLNPGKDTETMRTITRRLDEIVADSSPETLDLIAAFACSAKTPESDDLLFKIADQRIASYAKWSVRYELLDGSILQMLADRMEPSSPGKAAAGRRFGQLFSYALQRYIKGDKVLNKIRKEQLASVLVDTEKSCLPRLIKKQVSFGIKKAIEAGDLNALLTEHNNLLGDATKQGVLPAEAGFDYGKDKSGSTLTYPVELASAPQTLSSSQDAANTGS